MKTVNVQSGDTLSRIAKANNLTVDELAKANNISNPNRINVGQKLVIPDKFDSAPSTASAWNSFSNGTSGSAPASASNSTSPSSSPTAAPEANGQATASNGRTFPTSADGTPIFKQGDAQWGSRTLGTGLSLSSHGCAVTSTAMALSKISGNVVDPGELDAFLDNNGGYDGNSIYWDKAAKMAGMSAKTGGMNFDTLNQQLDAGRPVVIGVDHTGDGKTDHYVTLTGRNGNNYSANDPATGKEMSFTLQNGQLVGQSGSKTYKSSDKMISFSGGNAAPKTSSTTNAATTPATTNPAATNSTATNSTATNSAAKNAATSAATAVNATPGTSSGAGVSLEQLRSIMPNLSREKAEAYLPHLNAAMAEANINTPQRQAAFLAQLAHESGEFRWMQELASGAAYEGRKDLGNTQSGDGVRFKGRGPIQLTGRANYQKAGDALGIDLINNPKRAADPDVGFRTAAWFWSTRGLNEAADKGDFLTITKRINGGTNGLADRQKYYSRAQQTLGA